MYFNMENIVKILLVVGSGNSVFIQNYAKWIKKNMSCTISVFQIDARGSSHSPYYDDIDCTAGDYPSTLSYRGIRRFIDLYKYYRLYNYLRGKKFDIIHCHWLTGHTVFCVELLKSHCSVLIGTFWGGEFTQQYVFGSKYIYNKYLNKFLSRCDAVINSNDIFEIIYKRFPSFNGKIYLGNLGASGLDNLKKLLKNSSKDACKRYYGLPIDKLSVQIGYSGKSLHRHLDIIAELCKHPELKDKIHILNPMNRDQSSIYAQKVIQEIEKAGFTHTTIVNRFLSDEEVSILRYSTDIVLQLAEFDGFSRSILESFCAKAIVIYGNWLNYENKLKINGLEGIPVDSIAEGVNTLIKVSSNPKDYEAKCTKNADNAFNENMWETCIVNWINAYQDLLKF